jgi:hypothetical protein
MMRRFLIASAALLTISTSAIAGAFWPGKVIDIAWDDVLNIRKWPSAQSQIIDSYNNGDHVSMTGRCKNIVTNASFWIDGGQSTAWKHARMKRPNVWCQVMSPSGEVGWVRGAFVWPG